MRRWVWFFILIWPLFWPTFCGANEDRREYKIKAGYIYNFLKYTRFPNPSASLVLCSPDGEFIDIATSVINPDASPPVQLKVIEDLSLDCSAIFIPQSYVQWWQTRRHSEVLYHTLVIGEQQGFTEQQAQINFIQVGSKIRFEINIDNMRLADLSMSVNVLRLAKVVGGDEQ
uniref:YfiR family protein n=1 Tax=Thaumasiovibrio occultus TaxID=1891184 RepID=UPI000B34EFE7|nr:YfiR family protein [Thaumasiovibrio occultus]